MKILVIPPFASRLCRTGVLLLIASIIPNLGVAQSPSPTPVFNFPGPQACTTTWIPNVAMCRTETTPGVYNCVDYARDYCTGMRDLGYKAWSVGMQPDGSSCASAGLHLYNMLKGEGCITTSANGTNIEIEGACARPKVQGHALVMVKLSDERLKGGDAEFAMIEPQGQHPVVAWRTTQSSPNDFVVPASVIVRLRDLHFPLLTKYDVSLKLTVAASCELSRTTAVFLSVNGQKIEIK